MTLKQRRADGNHASVILASVILASVILASVILASVILASVILASVILASVIFDEFLNLFEPIFALAAALLNYRLFGAPLYTYLLSLFVFAFVTGFIRNGSFSLSGVGNAVAGGISAGKAASAERQRRERSNRVGFHPSED